MTRKQQVFIKEYLVDLNATRAATAAGYSARTAGEQASRLLANVKIREKVNDSIQKRAQKLEITADRVLSELAKLAFLDPRGFFNPDGSLKAVKDLDDATAASLAGIEHEKLFEHFSKGQAKEVGTPTKIKIEHSGLEGLAEQLAAMRQKKHASGT
jgi:phage terminase small subunit